MNVIVTSILIKQLSSSAIPLISAIEIGFMSSSDSLRICDSTWRYSKGTSADCAAWFFDVSANTKCNCRFVVKLSFTGAFHWQNVINSECNRLIIKRFYDQSIECAMSLLLLCYYLLPLFLILLLNSKWYFINFYTSHCYI